MSFADADEIERFQFIQPFQPLIVKIPVNSPISPGSFMRFAFHGDLSNIELFTKGE
jgi:hypothetical protein